MASPYLLVEHSDDLAVGMALEFVLLLQHSSLGIVVVDLAVRQELHVGVVHEHERLLAVLAQVHDVQSLVAQDVVKPRLHLRDDQP